MGKTAPARARGGARRGGGGPEGRGLREVGPEGRGLRKAGPGAGPEGGGVGGRPDCGQARSGVRDLAAVSRHLGRVSTFKKWKGCRRPARYATWGREFSLLQRRVEAC